VPLIAGCKHQLQVTIPPETVEEETERVVNQIRTRARIPGFRPGKAPASMVRLRFADEIRQEVLKTLIPRHLYQQIQAEGLLPVAAPDVSDVLYEPGEPLRFRAEFEVFPEFDLQPYRDLPVDYNAPEATEEEVAAQLEQVREQHAVYRNLDPRPLTDGDIAVIRLQSTATPPGVAPIRQEELNVELGSKDTLMEFTASLRGLSPGEQTKTEVHYPDDYGQPRLAGKSVIYQIEVLGLRSKELPEINDELAKDAGDYRGLEELRTRLRAEILEHKRHEAQLQTKAKLLDALVDAHDFPVPEKLVERQISTHVERGLQALAEQGVDPSKVRLDWQKIQQSQEPRSIREIKGGLILEKIAEVEHIRASQEEIDRQVQIHARQTGQPVAAAREKLVKAGALDRIRVQICQDKALQFLFEHARKG